MSETTRQKLLEAEETLYLKLPRYLFEFISGLTVPAFRFGHEEWIFWSVNDSPDTKDNYLVSSSLDFEKEWGLKAIVFADNGIGDFLLLLANENGIGFMPQVFVMMHETGELKQFAPEWKALVANGPDDYFYKNEYYARLNDEGKTEKWGEAGKESEEALADFFGEEYQLKSRLDDLIDDQETGKASEILSGLDKLCESTDVSYKTWALNKLSDLYLRGFGPVPANLEKALALNQQAMDLNSHKAFSNRAACYFAGIGMERDLKKSLEYAVKANELSKSNQFADVVGGKPGGGMYEDLVEMIRKEMEKGKS